MALGQHVQLDGLGELVAVTRPHHMLQNLGPRLQHVVGGGVHQQRYHVTLELVRQQRVHRLLLSGAVTASRGRQGRREGEGWGERREGWEYGGGTAEGTEGGGSIDGKGCRLGARGKEMGKVGKKKEKGEKRKKGYEANE